MTKPMKPIKRKKSVIVTIMLISLVVGITILPLIVLKDAKFAGADDNAKKAIVDIKVDYKPWVAPLFVPKSAEVESLIFSLQAATGSGIVFYGLGYMRGRKKREEEAKQ